MLKQLFTGSLIAAVLTIACFPAQAQTQAPAPAPTAQAAVSSQEVQQFVTALKEMRSIHDEAQTQAGQIIQSQGLTVPRYNEILQSQQGTAPSSAVTSQEQQQFNQALSQITQIQQAATQRMEQAIQGSGLEVPRFNQIFSIARQDPSLKQQIEQGLQN